VDARENAGQGGEDNRTVWELREKMSEEDLAEFDAFFEKATMQDLREMADILGVTYQVITIDYCSFIICWKSAMETLVSKGKLSHWKTRSAS